LTHTQFIKIGEDSPKGENTGKFQPGNRYINVLSKILEEIPPGEKEYPRKIQPANRNTN
jgi:hypothetical protein